MSYKVPAGHTIYRYTQSFADYPRLVAMYTEGTVIADSPYFVESGSGHSVQWTHDAIVNNVTGVFYDYMGDNTEISAELLNKEYGETLGYLLQRNCAENINGELLSDPFGIPLKYLRFASNETVKTISATIPNTVTEIGCDYDLNLTTFSSVIPSSVESLSFCFYGCEKLTGSIKINANPVHYEECFTDTILPIKLSGTSNLKQQIAATANNGNVTIGEQPRCDYTPLSKLTTDWIKSVTIARTTISNATAYDGATVANVRLTIGSATASIPGDGIIAVRINDAGTYTPYITVTDSNGNSRTYTLDPITIQDYSKPTITDISIERVIAPISQDDTQAKITCTIGHRYQMSGNKLGVPEVSVNGNDISDEISWYDDTQKQVPYSGNYTGPPKIIYGWVDEIREIFHQTDTYTFTLSIADSYTESDSKTEVLPSIFSTMNFKRGGKEIAFGAKADDDLTEYDNGLFKCGMSFLDVPMIGEVKMWAGRNIPIGWLLCDGSEVKKTDYPYLYEAIGDIYGVASSSDRFVLPNSPRRVPVGYDPNDTDTEENFALGSYGGARGAWYHNHTQNSHNHTIPKSGGGSGSLDRMVNESNRKEGSVASSYATPYINYSGSTNNRLPADKANMPSYFVMKFIIRAY